MLVQKEWASEASLFLVYYNKVQVLHEATVHVTCCSCPMAISSVTVMLKYMFSSTGVIGLHLIRQEHDSFWLHTPAVHSVEKVSELVAWSIRYDITLLEESLLLKLIKNMSTPMASKVVVNSPGAFSVTKKGIESIIIITKKREWETKKKKNRYGKLNSCCNTRIAFLVDNPKY